MLMKDGSSLPPALADALESDGYALTVFLKMRPSCQKRYAGRVLDAKDKDTAKTRAAAILSEVHKYGQKHGI